MVVAPPLVSQLGNCSTCSWGHRGTTGEKEKKKKGNKKNDETSDKGILTSWVSDLASPIGSKKRYRDGLATGYWLLMRGKSGPEVWTKYRGIYGWMSMLGK